MSTHDTLTNPHAISFASLSAILHNIEDPSPSLSSTTFAQLRTRFDAWGAAASLPRDFHPDKPRPPPHPLLTSSEEARTAILNTLLFIEWDFTDETNMVSNCGLVKKKSVGSSFKRGLKKLGGGGNKRNSLGLNPALGGAAAVMESKWVVGEPHVWARKLDWLSGEIEKLAGWIPIPAAAGAGGIGSVTNQMAGLAVAPVPPPPPPTTGQVTAANGMGKPAVQDPAEAEEERWFAEIDKLEEFVKEKDKGGLSISLAAATNYSSRITARAYFEGEDDSSPSPWRDEAMGYVKMGHPSFELYHKGKFMKPRTSKYSTTTDEDCVLMDCEAHHKYEHRNVGTLTVDGFGLEAWDYEAAFGRERDTTVFVSYSAMPEVRAAQLLRRLSELQNSAQKFGWNPLKEKHDLQEFFGNMGTTYLRDVPESQKIGDFYQQLNRRDIFTDFTTLSSISTQWASTTRIPEANVMGLWNFLYQLILAKECHLRLQHLDDASYTGFTQRVLASLILADLWLRNVTLIITETTIPASEINKPFDSEAKKAEAYAHHKRAEDLAYEGNWAAAEAEYTAALAINPSIPEFISSRAGCYEALCKWAEAFDDSVRATKMDPGDFLNWRTLGRANLEFGKANYSRAKAAFEKALSLEPDDSAVRSLLAGVIGGDGNRHLMLQIEKDPMKQLTLQKEVDDEEWDMNGKSLEFHSRVHERQVEGLIYFAERIKWPFISELREEAEDVYSRIRAGETLPFQVVDWVFGTTLPGQWAALKIMSTLILLTKSVKGLGIAPFYDCGFVTQGKSWWRVRGVLGRVLGAVKGVGSHCGWIGPCPAVTFDPPLPQGRLEEEGKKGRHIRVKARRNGVVPSPDPNDPVIRITVGGGHGTDLRPKPGENFDTYLADIKNDNMWQPPTEPEKLTSFTALDSVVLKALPLEGAVDTADADAVETATEYRATLNFTVNTRPVAYTLFTNPVFVSLPPCSGGPHVVHKREMGVYSTVVKAEELKDWVAEEEEGIVVVNATGEGAETLARAWCAERGRAAVVRRWGGPCFTCAVRGARELMVKVVIWVS